MEECRACGKRGWIDAIGGCSAECDGLLIERFVAMGHNHGPDDPPWDYDETSKAPCPVCRRGLGAFL